MHDAATDSEESADENCKWITVNAAPITSITATPVKNVIDAIDAELPQSTTGRRLLADECYKTARKNKDFKSMCRFADLVNFYLALPRSVTRESASLKVARGINKGPYHARLIRKDARYFEKTGRLPVADKAQRSCYGSLLDDEDVFLGVQTWLRTQAVGSVCLLTQQCWIHADCMPADYPLQTQELRQ